MDGQDPPEEKGDPFLLNYSSTDLRIASEFLSNWLPFLTKDLCQLCTQTLSDRVRSIVPPTESDKATEPLNKECHSAASTSNNEDWNDGDDWNQDMNPLGSWKDEEEEKLEMNDVPDFSSFQTNQPLKKEPTSNNEDFSSFQAKKPFKKEPISNNGDFSSFEAKKPFKKEPISNNEDFSSFEAKKPFKKEPISNNEDFSSFEAKEPYKKEPISHNEDSNYVSEDDFEVDGDEEEEVHREVVKGHSRSGEATMRVRVLQNAHLSKEEKMYNRFSNVKREMDYICLERVGVGGRIVNILNGLELHTGVFSAAEQTKIADFVCQLQEMAKKSKGRRQWQRGNRRFTLQFGCCYNYGFDKRGNPPGILLDEIADPLPKIFKTMIKRLVRWHVVPPACIPDCCTVHVYEEGDSIPPHIDICDFLRPFCTVSLLSECSMVFGSSLTFLGAGASHEIALPVGSVVVLSGNSADVSKHFIPPVPAKRISITFRKMDESKWPNAYNPAPDLQGIQPLYYENNKTRWQKNPNARPFAADKQQAGRRVGGGNREGSYGRENVGRPGSIQIQRGPDNTRRVRVNPDRYD